MSQPAESFWKDARVLIAEDEPDMREIFAAWLRNVGSAVEEVADGEEALQALAHGKFDAIVTDVRMPRVTGIELVRSLHASRSNTPVIIFVSGFVDLPLPDAYDMGVEAVLSKPCHRKELLQALRRSILRRKLVFDPGEGIPAPLDTDHLEYSDESDEEAPLAVGRGGISLNTREILEPGTSLKFSLELGRDLPPRLSGWGVVRWSEAFSKKVRTGIEFMYLEEQSREAFARWLQENQPASFIPKEYSLRTAPGSL